eukprot:CAMPEP_0206444210 /NCGR_PEP_ID=MMETSP0324_2-20121206/14789_1 /ASSEMBLY_ACC=CAM_ASM_000836 /TAXON_ID=2866 /ORGANISM="Crypthecodinium cohnii, Strain Seligo" /LENGTH=106 /DNA_ID=CAMNT_0053912215 /DNA_START=277 /DNA_END=593 /DNA_ORIENTATION=+
MRPAGTAILRNVLIAGLAAEVLAVLVAPSEALGEALGREKVVGVGEVAPPSDAQGLGLLSAQDLTASLGRFLSVVTDEDSRRELLGVILGEARAGDSSGLAPGAAG